MTAKTSIIQGLRDYFTEKGHTMTFEEYKAQEDAPFRPILVKRILGSWARTLNYIGDIPEEVEDSTSKEPIKEPTK